MIKHPKLHSNPGSNLANIILGGQDGLVNVLGLVLGLSAAGSSTHVILAGGLAATFAESISMGAVAYTSKRAEEDYLEAQQTNEPNVANRPTTGTILGESLVVGISTLIGSILPLIPFFFLASSAAASFAVAISALALLSVGAYKAKQTAGKPFRGAVQMMFIGLGAALAGYLIGLLFR